MASSIKTSYTYNTSVAQSTVFNAPVMISATGPDTKTTKYEWSGRGITCIIPKNKTQCQITNSYDNVTAGTTYQVTQQILADGSMWKFDAYGIPDSRSDDILINEIGSNGSSTTNPDKKTATYMFNKSSPWRFIDENGRETNYKFTGGYETDLFYYADPLPPELPEGALVTEIVNPEGDSFSAIYDISHMNAPVEYRWKAKPGSLITDRVVTFGYAFPGDCWLATAYRKTCAKPLSTRDEKGNQTDITYDYATGEMLTEMRPPPAVGLPRPLTVKTFTQHYAWIKSALGALVRAADPIWLIATETKCQTITGSTAPICDTAAPKIVSTYQYGADGTADNLLLRGVAMTAGAQLLRTCYSYDAIGNKISETKPRAGLVLCP
jgi:hypothetical protein